MPVQTRIDRTLVHKDAQTAVLLTSATKSADGQWLFDITLPQGHSTARQSASGFATILGAELMRQAALAFAHLDSGVPLNWAFLLHELSFDWHQDPAAAAASRDLVGCLQVRTLAVGRRKDRISDLQLEATLTADGRVLGTGYGDLSCLPPANYKAIRRNAPPVEQVNTGSLGTTLTEVRRNGHSLEARLVWNWEDPFIFDHFSDHLPGMLLGQVMLEAHHTLTGAEASRLHLRCGTFGEFNAPVQVRAQLTANNNTRVTITQNGGLLATGLSGCAGENISGPGTPRFQRRIG